MIDWIERCRQHLDKQPKKPALGVVVNGRVVPVSKPKPPAIPKKPKF